MNGNSLFSLKDKVAIVTGGTGILGKHFCPALAQAGAHVVIVDRSQLEVETFAQQITQEFGIKSIGIACDVADATQVDRMVNTVIAEFNQIDILHNNAATKGTNNLREFFEPTENFPMHVWKEVMSVNVDGLFLIGRAVGSIMARQGYGSIIQTGSIYGIVAPDQRIYEGSDYLGGPINTPAVYSASKAAVVGLTRYFATLWGSKGVRVNTLIPGGVKSGQNETFIKNYSNRVPLGRMAHPEEMVGPLIFLASDASSYMTGQEVIVDGGLTCW